MQRKSSKTILRTAVILVGSMWAMLAAQTSAPSSLESQLETIYKVTQLEGNTKTVIAPGALLRVTKANLLYETPLDNMFRCNANVKQDKAQIPGGSCIAMTKSVGSFLQAGQLLYISKIKVNAAKDIVTFELVEAAAGPNGTAAWPNFKTGVNFVFDPGYLAKADPGQIADLINTVIPLDDGGSDNSQAAAPQPGPQNMQDLAALRASQRAARAQLAAQQQAAATPAQPAATGGQVVQLGMTEDEVKGILGQPTGSSNFSGMTIYVYQKTITFQNGKVSAIR
jgi:hypothetical protein